MDQVAEEFACASKVVMERHPGPGGDRLGPAYLQDEPGRGARNHCIMLEQILSPGLNLLSGWNPNQNVPGKKRHILQKQGGYSPTRSGERARGAFEGTRRRRMRR
jgi:hypothetical protein